MYQFMDSGGATCKENIFTWVCLLGLQFTQVKFTSGVICNQRVIEFQTPSVYFNWKLICNLYTENIQIENKNKTFLNKLFSSKRFNFDTFQTKLK